MKIKDIKNYSIINESLLLEDPVYRSFKQVGRYIAERRMSEKEILQVFADVEAGMTDPATGANRTMLGRGKDQTTKLAASIRDSVNTVLKNIQDSVPVSAVDAIYDTATDAVANLAGGQKGQVMQAIKKYRMLVKKYPKSAGFAKAALVAITGLATGGASLPAIAGLTYALDAAIKGEKLSSVLGKGAGAAALAWAGQAVAGAVSGTDPAAQGIGISATGAAPAGADPMSNFVTPDKFPTADLPTYTAQAGDNLSKIAARFDVSVGELRGLNPQLADATGATGGQSMNPDVIFPGQEITLPPASGSGTYAGGVGTSAGTQADIASGQVPDSEISRRMAQVRESVNVLVLPMAQLRNQVSTRLLQELNESRGRPNSGLMLTDRGVNTVFENIDRYRRAISELAGVPGSTRPALYRPDAPDAPAPAAKKPGMISRGLSKVGGALSTAGRQFTTNVTKEKLKMNWHIKGKPSDSDQLAAWLAKEQGVPQDVVATVYQKMNIPLAAPAGASTPVAPSPYGKGDPEQTKITVAKMSNEKLQSFISKATDPANPHVQIAKAELAKRQATGAAPAGGAGAFGAMTKSLQQPEKSSTGGTTAQTATGLKHTASAQNPNATPAQPTAAAAGTKPGAQPAAYNAANVMKLPGMEKYAKASPAVAPRAANFAGPSGYGQTTMGFKAPGAARTPAVAAAVPKTSRATAQGGAPTKTPTQAEKDAYVRSIGAPALPEADQEKVGNMDADRFDAAMARLKQLAGAGPLKTVYDPAKRVYRNVPTAVQPPTQPKK